MFDVVVPLPCSIVTRTGSKLARRFSQGRRFEAAIGNLMPIMCFDTAFLYTYVFS